MKDNKGNVKWKLQPFRISVFNMVSKTIKKRSVNILKLEFEALAEKITFWNYTTFYFNKLYCFITYEVSKIRQRTSPSLALAKDLNNHTILSESRTHFSSKVVAEPIRNIPSDSHRKMFRLTQSSWSSIILK